MSAAVLVSAVPPAAASASPPRYPDAPPVLRLADPGVPAADLPVEELGSRIVGMAGRLAAATCEWLLLVADFDARDGCARFGLASTARWLTHCCGVSHRTAVEQVRVARALLAFPSLAEAMSTGRVSYSHVRAIARVAKAGEDTTVADLLEVAQAGTVGQLELIVRGLRTVEDLENFGDEPPDEYVRTGWSSQSQWRLSARLAPERGALIDRALDTVRATEDLSPAEALERVAEIALVVLSQAGRAPALRGDERAAVVVHLDLSTARAAVERSGSAPSSSVRQPGSKRGTEPEHGLEQASLQEVQRQAEQEPHPVSATPARDAAPRTTPLNARRWWGRIADGPGLPDAVIERLLCEGRLRTNLYQQDGSMFDLGRTRRLVSVRLMRALRERDGGCTHPGCGSRDGLEAHHVRHWLYGGRTDLANLVLLCRRHHHAHHGGEFLIAIRDNGTFAFRRADGRLLEQHVDASRLMAGAPDVLTDRGWQEQGPRWTGTGERLDRHWAVGVLAQRRADDAERRHGTERLAS